MTIKREVYISYAINVSQKHAEFRQFFPFRCHFLAILNAAIPSSCEWQKTLTIISFSLRVLSFSVLSFSSQVLSHRLSRSLVPRKIPCRQ